MRRLLPDRLNVYMLLVQFFLQALYITPVLHIDKTDRTHILACLFGRGIATLSHQDIVLFVSAYHAIRGVILLLCLASLTLTCFWCTDCMIALRRNNSHSHILQRALVVLLDAIARFSKV